MSVKKAKILIVDDEHDILDGLKKLLSNEGFTVKTADSGKKFLAEIGKFMPDLILMDVMLGDTDGYELKEELKKNIETASIPVIFISVNKSLDFKRHGFEAGAQDYVVKPFDTDDLIIRIESILSRRQFYEDMYMRDTLTGLYNKSIFEKQARIQFGFSVKYGRPFSIVVVDINGLKAINSKHGHETGDFVLKKTAEAIKEITRGTDIATRYSSDEFVVLLPETGYEQARTFIKRLKKGVDSREFRFDKEKKIAVAISTGSATCRNGEVSLEKMFAIADLNMHVEKSRTEKKSIDKSVLIIEDEVDIARGIQLELQAEGFSVAEILFNFEDAVSYIDISAAKDAPGFVILDLNLDGKLSLDFLGNLYSKWKDIRVYIYTAYIQYMDLYPYFRDVVSGVFLKSEFSQLIASLKNDSR